MPAYNYECKNCGGFEVKHPMKAEPMKHCPMCGNKIRKLINKPAIIYHCGGFYVTDNRRNK